MIKCFHEIYRNKKVLLTGHTGFKGSWLALWLTRLGAKVVGYSLKPPTQPNHFDLLKLEMESIIGDVGQKDKIEKVVQESQPDIIFHLAAQSLVRLSYERPIETFQTNVMGSVNVLEAARKIESVKAIVNITSDKCYENKERPQGYREDEPMGGFDPYSASKGCAELVTNAYRNSFFPIQDYKKSHQVLLASVRAGNVIGGGDWAQDRLFPDIVRAITQEKEMLVRYPQAARPWQHVLEPLSGYLLLGQKLLEGQSDFAEAWNIGPLDDSPITVKEIIDIAQARWHKFSVKQVEGGERLHEAHYLKLDCTKASTKLQWRTLWNISTTIQKTIDWYKAYYDEKRILSLEQLEEYVEQTL